ncbi:hypothetical protein [Campylobacter canadensis]|uniref:hypothetical protein n=1 Tax=Campylobacter canadensis TaxID=449520 RepID=UPI001CCF9A40|nr:hypothetical protein [Campylobacter canadensis]MBZ8003085.1 hypothetical protein [Campylobacter canadensis]
MKCYLHIGVQKTGTTSIQKFLTQNYEKLLQNGILYPLSAGKNSSQWSIAAINYNYDKHKDENDFYLVNKNIKNKDDFIKHTEKRKKAIYDEILKSNCKSVIFSSEHLTARLFYEEEIQNLKDFLSIFDEVYVIIYIREQIKAINSAYSEAIKAANILDYSINDWYLNIFDYSSVIKKYEQFFTNINVRIFDFNEFENNDLISDFCKACNINIPDLEINLSKSNESIDLLGLKILEFLNNDYPFYKDGKVNPKRRELNQLIAKFFNDKNNNLSLPKDIQEEYLKYFAQGNKYIKDKYFKDKDSLFNSSIVKENYNINIDNNLLNFLAYLIKKTII